MYFSMALVPGAEKGYRGPLGGAVPRRRLSESRSSEGMLDRSGYLKV